MSRARKHPSVGAGRRPKTKQRSEFVALETNRAWLGQLVASGGRFIGQWQRNVHDGHLMVMVTLEPRVTDEPEHLHLSISHRTNTGPPKPGRYPTWDEIADARYKLLPDELTFAMVLPPPSSYVAHHDTTFHLHQTDDPRLVEPNPEGAPS